MARLAYYSFDGDEVPRLRVAVGAAGFKGLKTFSKSLDTQAFVARRDDGLAVVAFRGTQPESLFDIGVDASAGLVAWRGEGRVHLGFRDAFEAVREDVENWVSSAGLGADQLLVCGHSLGGALATLAGALWRQAKIVTIGSPRVGDGPFAASVSGPRCQRIFNCCDLVARVPPRELGYDHLEESFFIAANGESMPNPGAARIDAERHLGRGEYFSTYAGFGNAPARDLADHAPINYLRAFFS
jgi:pimeloyl-ACP methyl ester carboxylesterase